MANYPTHIAVGTLVSGALATLTLAADVIAPENLVAVTMAGVLGSILPDIDLQSSRASRMMFGGLAIFFSFCVLFTFAETYSIAELWIVWLGTIIFVRYFLHEIFHRISIHRGVWHSLLAAVFVSFATAAVFYQVFGRHEGVAWLAAGFMFIGYIVHLLLDEMYSVDFMDRRLKNSFGTALKWIDTRRPTHTAAMACMVAAVFFATPSTKTFVDGITSDDLWAGLNNRLLPEDNSWFGFIDVKNGEVAFFPDFTAEPGSFPSDASQIETGSIKKTD